jgi:hypothetical protein
MVQQLEVLLVTTGGSSAETVLERKQNSAQKNVLLNEKFSYRIKLVSRLLQL